MEEFNLSISGKEAVITVLKGEAPKPINLQPVRIGGNIFAPAIYIEKRKHLISERSHVEIDAENGSIIFIEDENSPISTEVTGRLQEHPNLQIWGINKGMEYSSLDLARKIKMNRFMFPSITQAMELVNIFQSLKMKVSKEVELADDKRGNRTSVQVQVVQKMSIPETFSLNVPLFTGFQPAKFEVELSINAETLSIELISPQLNELREGIIEGILQAEEAKIFISMPGLPILHS